MCAVVRELLEPYNIGCVIARPFIGVDADSFERTGNRRDLSLFPPAKTLLDFNKDAGREVIAVGGISDIYAGQGITKSIKATGLCELFDHTLAAQQYAPLNSIVCTNFVDFDSVYGHRRDIAGYAGALEYFDQR